MPIVTRSKKNTSEVQTPAVELHVNKRGKKKTEIAATATATATENEEAKKPVARGRRNLIKKEIEPEKKLEEKKTDPKKVTTSVTRARKPRQTKKDKDEEIVEQVDVKEQLTTIEEETVEDEKTDLLQEPSRVTRTSRTRKSKETMEIDLKPRRGNRKQAETVEQETLISEKVDDKPVKENKRIAKRTAPSDDHQEVESKKHAPEKHVEDLKPKRSRRKQTAEEEQTPLPEKEKIVEKPAKEIKKVGNKRNDPVSSDEHEVNKKSELIPSDIGNDIKEQKENIVSVENEDQKKPVGRTKRNFNKKEAADSEIIKAEDKPEEHKPEIKKAIARKGRKPRQAKKVESEENAEKIEDVNVQVAALEEEQIEKVEEEEKPEEPKQPVKDTVVSRGKKPKETIEDLKPKRGRRKQPDTIEEAASLPVDEKPVKENKRTAKRTAPSDDEQEAESKKHEPESHAEFLKPKRGRRKQAAEEQQPPALSEKEKIHEKPVKETKKGGNKRKAAVVSDDKEVIKPSVIPPVDIVDIVGDIKEQVAMAIENESQIINDDDDENFLRVSDVMPTANANKRDLDDSLELLVGSDNKSDADDQVNETFIVEKKPKLEHKVTGILMTWGDDMGGELGLKRIGIEKKKPTVVDNLPDSIRKVVAAPMHTVCLTASGVVYSFGNNDECALARSTKDRDDAEAHPEKVPLSVKVTKISAGDSHTAMLTALGSVYYAGNFRDQNDKIGLTAESKESVPMPIILNFDLNVIDIASGDNHILFLTKSGDVYSLGVGENGQLGRLTSDECCFKKVKNPSLFLKPQKVNTLTKCDRIWATPYTSFCRGVDDKLYAWGLNNYSQLGIPRTNEELNKDTIEYFPMSVFKFIPDKATVEQIAGGSHHTLALDSKGRVYSCGRYEYGRLGHGANSQDEIRFKLISSLEKEFVTMIACGPVTSYAVTETGHLYCWGMDSPTFGAVEADLFEPMLFKSVALKNKRVLSISSGTQHSAIIVVDEQLNGNSNNNHD